MTSTHKTTRRQHIVRTAAPGDEGAYLRLLTGASAGGKIALDGRAIEIGRSFDAGFRIDCSGVSRRHCRVWREGSRCFVRDLASTNGTFVNGRQIQAAELSSGDRLTVGNAVFVLVDEGSPEASYQELMQQLASSDELTGLLNLRGFRAALQSALDDLSARPLVLLALDLDRFKCVNDVHGHEAGNVVLKAIADLVRSQIRPLDAAGRLGGEEFAILLPRCSLSGAVARAERLRQCVEQLRFPGAPGLLVTISIGIAVATTESASAETLLKDADERLYRAKADGRNQTCAA